MEWRPSDITRSLGWPPTRTCEERLCPTVDENGCMMMMMHVLLYHHLCHRPNWSLHLKRGGDAKREFQYVKVWRITYKITGSSTQLISCTSFVRKAIDLRGVNHCCEKNRQMPTVPSSSISPTWIIACKLQLSISHFLHETQLFIIYNKRNSIAIKTKELRPQLHPIQSNNK